MKKQSSDHIQNKLKKDRGSEPSLSSDDSKFRDILLISNDWIWEIDTQGVFTFTSGQIKEILGYEREEIIGKHVFDIFVPEERESLKQDILKLIATEKPIISRENWNLTKDGKRVCLVTNGIPIYDQNGKLIGYRGVDKDITLQKQAEQALLDQIEEKERIGKLLIKAKQETENLAVIRSDFIFKLSHEIRTPMNGILGTAALLKESSLTNEQRDFLEIIEDSTQNLLSILNDVLDLTEIETKNIEFDQINFNLIELLNELERKYAPVTKDKRLHFNIDIKPGVPKFLKGDAFRLKQVLCHLLNNAIKFTKKGNITLSLEQGLVCEDKIKIIFKVMDTGIGLSTEHKKSVFQGFFEGGFRDLKTYGGSGLGLIICRKLIHMMGGKIGVESAYGKGSTFWFSLHYNHGLTPQPQPFQNVEEEPGTLEDKLKILVAEDNIINQKVVVANLRQLGHDVEIAVNGKMAVEMFKKNKYDLILMDIQMPVMDGITATKEIRKIEKEKGIKNEVKIIAVTANVSKEDKKECLKIGMSGYIIKPFNTEDLDLALKTT